MTVRELCNKLSKMDPNFDVCAIDAAGTLLYSKAVIEDSDVVWIDFEQ